MSKVTLNIKNPNTVKIDVRDIENCKLAIVRLKNGAEPDSVVIIPKHDMDSHVIFFESEISYSDMKYFYDMYEFVRYLTEDESIVLKG